MSEAEEHAKFAEMFGDDPLHPDLDAYTQVHDDGSISIKHPLVYSVFHFEQQNRMVNRSLALKREGISKAEAEARWVSYVWHHERPYRLWAFTNIMEQIEDDAEFWELLGGIWVDSENIFQNEVRWRSLFISEHRPGREYLMEPEEREALAALPETLTIHRGFTVDGRERGLSWTLDAERAEWFAKRFLLPGQNPCVATATIRRSDAIAHFTGRGEAEIVVIPNTVIGDDYTIRRVSP